MFGRNSHAFILETNSCFDVRFKRYAEKPCERRRRKEKVMAFTCMLRARYAS